MSVDGERPPRQGQIFSNRAIALLKDLGYDEEFRSRYGLDFVANPPKRQKISPSFSPNGRTAFEFKSGFRLNLEKECRKLNRKISSFNRHKSRANKIAGGVIVTDTKTRLPVIQRCLTKYAIYVWDTHALCFLSSKVSIHRLWTLGSTSLKEELLTDSTVIVRQFASYRNCFKIKVAVYYQDRFSTLDLATFNELIKQLTTRCKEIVRETGIRTYVTPVFHSLAEIGHEVEENFRRILQDASSGFITYETGSAQLVSYESAPWYGLILSAS